jgi:uncharacterized protein YgbK (DUF1537 family)
MKDVDAREPERARFSIIADDLTGACDSAVAFTRRGLRVEVLLEKGAHLPADGVWAISTESRDVAEDTAVQRVGHWRVEAGKTQEIFKKVDSVFRGNTFAEIREAVNCFPAELVVLSPAYPAMGRVVRGGVLFIEDASGNRQIDLREGLHRVGLNDFAVVSAGEQSLRAAVEARKTLVLCDGESEQDLRRIVAAARGLGKKTLWVGSGGLANALAGELPAQHYQQECKAVEGVVLLFVGSDHAVTQRQVEALRSSAAVWEASIDQFSGVEVEYEFVVLNVPRAGVTENQIRYAVSCLKQRVACCLMTGGDTAMLVCRALGMSSLVLTKEFAPGLPQGFAVGGMLDGVPVVLKSGGFGAIDVLCGLSSRFVKRKELA